MSKKGQVTILCAKRACNGLHRRSSKVVSAARNVHASVTFDSSHYYFENENNLQQYSHIAAHPCIPLHK